MNVPTIVLVTPAGAGANNGNWRTAARWARMLRGEYRVRVVGGWDGGDEAMMIALHARRSAASIAAWRAHHPGRPLLVVLTGTDLYRDIDVDASARASLQAADALVVLNELGARRLPGPLRARTHVVLQSCAARAPVKKTARWLRALAVGHLRAEKDPRTVFEAARRLAGRDDIRIDLVGAALDPVLGAEAAATAAALPCMRWLGELAHADTRRRVAAAHVLVHASTMEGGAHAVIEAVRSGTPVLASRIDGNVGLLGEDYGGYFPAGDAACLAALLARLRDEPDRLAALAAQCAQRAPLFTPAHERDALRRIVAAIRRD